MQHRVGLAGFGTVGTALARQLAEERQRYRRDLGADVRLAAVFDRSWRRKDRSWLPEGVLFTDSLDEFLGQDVDIVAEVIGGEGPADQVIRRTLEKGRSLATANKLLLARNGSEYLRLASRHGAFLGIEATVAGGIPVLRALRRSLHSDRITGLRGILNATCNFILSEMAATGATYQEALAKAQQLGYAEADPSLDVSGRDAADKLRILCAMCFGLWPRSEDVPVLGIEAVKAVDFRYASRLGYAIRLLASATLQSEAPRLRVAPFLVSNKLPLSKIMGETNAVELEGARLGSCVLSGPGAGGAATAVSVASDILNAAQWRKSRSAFHAPPSLIAARKKHAGDASREIHPFYLRFFVRDRHGILAELCGVLARHKINIHTVMQEEWGDPSNLPFIITVEPTLYAQMERALAEISRLDFHTRPPLSLPIANPG